MAQGIFDFEVDRSQSDSIKWRRYSRYGDVIPAWVADTDFLSSPAIREAIARRAEHGVYGYAEAVPEVSDAVRSWFKQEYGFDFSVNALEFQPNLVSCLNLACRAFANRTGQVISFSPMYHHFHLAPYYSGRTLAEVPLEINSGRWTFDPDRLRQAEGDCLLLCSPHNPCGTVFTREELQTIGQIALEKNWIIVSDEVHADLNLLTDRPHHCFPALSEELRQRTVLLSGASKAFNIPGLSCVYSVIENRELRRTWEEYARGIMASPSIFGLVATQAAYTQSRDWLYQQLSYLRESVRMISERLGKLGINWIPPEATYLAWINVCHLGEVDLQQHFLKHGLAISPGSQFHGPGFVRLNFGCSHLRLAQILDRFERAVTDTETN